MGRRLKHVKENDLAHGQWERWLREEVDIHPRVAQMHMKVAETPGLKTRTSSQMGLDALYLIATLPPEERTREHTLKSGVTKTVDEMTVRELREVKAALKKERERGNKRKYAHRKRKLTTNWSAALLAQCATRLRKLNTLRFAKKTQTHGGHPRACA
ncbi:DUF3102 domain-containing protein [Paenibacillus woosongensis]|uniref:DUF3102 domain-containing protein n=1 Tax=Paenibacillus woosongensis TaxID=307580 RepID=A0AA95L2M1_9BACL|nr:DUF3102 domain-containing protein [Paenibacillus woosongensis]WHX51609.1 DUF3102 domain-containing protein [Paenibacillus woosongensis]